MVATEQIQVADSQLTTDAPDSFGSLLQREFKPRSSRPVKRCTLRCTPWLSRR